MFCSLIYRNMTCISLSSRKYYDLRIQTFLSFFLSLRGKISGSIIIRLVLIEDSVEGRRLHLRLILE